MAARQPTKEARAQAAPHHKLQYTAAGVIAAGRVAKSSYCDHSGWGQKQGSIIKSWKKRYFVLKGRELIYFAERSPSGKGIDEKGRLRVADVEFTPEFTNGLIMRGELKGQLLKMQVDTNEACLEWFNAVRAAIQAEVDSALAAGKAGGVGGTAGVSMQGWLYKEGQNFKTWKRRYMTLCGRVIKYHAQMNEQPLGEARVNDVNINNARSFALDIYSDNNRIFRIAASSFAEIEAWDLAIARAIGKAPCFGDPYAAQPAPFLGESVEEAVVCEGWLYKRGQRSTAWQKRYFTLRGAGAIEYADGPSEPAKGTGELLSLKLVGERGAHCLEFQLRSGRNLSVSADAQLDIDKWLRAACEVLQLDPEEIPSVLPNAAAPSPAASAPTATPIGGLRRKLSRALSNASSTTATLSSNGSGRFSENSSTSGGDGVSSYLTGMEIQDAKGYTARSSLSDSKPRKSGWLRKEGYHVHSLKRRYFVAEARAITYFEQIGEAAKGQGVVKSAAFNTCYPNCLDLNLTTGRALRVVAESPEEIRSWFEYFNYGADKQFDMEQRVAGDEGVEMGGRASEIAQRAQLAENGEGWLLKKGKNFRSWKRRYFHLDGNKLSYAAAESGNPLGCGVVRSVVLGNERPFCLDVQFQNGRVLHVVASCEEEMVAWNRALHVAASLSESSDDVNNAGDENENEVYASTDEEFDYDDLEEDHEARLDNMARAVTAATAFKRQVSAARAARARAGGSKPPSRLNSVSSDNASNNDDDDDDNEDEDDAFKGRGSAYLAQQRLSGSKAMIANAKMGTSSANLEPSDLVVCSGWLRKEGGTVKNWKQRYFTLHGLTLCYFKSDNGPLLRNLTVCHVVAMRTKQLCLEITTESGRKLLVASDSRPDFDRWLSAFQRALAIDKERKMARAASEGKAGGIHTHTAPEQDAAVSYKVL